ncbi:helix-hairpin-helix domain-containing protein [Carboxydothermus pertinax]|uniref:Competence protein n=1 Tax=Carboxydothermus pertinax TaxID=870242 RepID=A0A1L8CT79_9THEO|nr:helix-hairpin-helix domain-containing protein [Carboxydothermus pertinax]GAV22029.1 competence protein [Carboxydothermus pertinax]
MKPLEDRSKIPLYGIIILLLGVIFYFWGTKPEEAPVKEASGEEVVVLNTEKSSSKVVVQVAGAVYKPGVYSLEEGSRVKDALEKAQGMLPSADDSSINLAAKVTDGQKIYIPFRGENQAPSAPVNNAFGKPSPMPNQSNKVNINTATLEELDKLPGVGPATAAKIIEYREQNGPFTTIEDIKKVKGIGDKKFESLKDYITIN